MFSVLIKAKHLMHNQNYRGSHIRLPADKTEILDVLDNARVPYGSGEYLILSSSYAPEFMSKMLGPDLQNPSIYEMNHLAERMAQLEEHELDMVKGIVQMRGSYDIANVINATHNLHRFTLHPIATDDYSLGEIAIESDDGMLPLLAQVPDELLGCLDREKIGVLVRENDGGVFTESGYLIPEDAGWDVIYEGKSLAERAVKLEPDDPIISLYMRHDDMPGDVPSVCLNFPASTTDIEAALKELGAKDRFDNIRTRSVLSPMPALSHGLSCSTHFEGINKLAKAIKTHCAGQLAKYKAAYEF